MVEKNMLTIPILQAIEQSTECPLCYLWLKTEKTHMEDLLTDEVVMNPEFRQKVVLAKGFCNHHMHLLYNTAYKPGVLDGLGYALYMQSIIESISEPLRLLSMKSMSNFEGKWNLNVLRRGKKRRVALSRMCKDVSHAFQGKGSCPACESLEASDKINLHTLLKMLDDDEFRQGFRSSTALCVPHLLTALEMLSLREFGNSVAVTSTLVEAEKSRLQTIADYLSEFVRKSDWEARNEPRGPEVNANNLTVNILVGAQGLYVARRYDED